MTEISTELAVPESPPLQMPEPILRAVVTEPGQMGVAQQDLIVWCDRKLAALQADQNEAIASYEIARKAKWRSAPLKAAADKIERRMRFYRKVKQALEAGYVIVPNFPCDVFAIRTRRHEPKQIMSHSLWRVPEQHGEALEPGAGHYENPLTGMAELREVIPATGDRPKREESTWWPTEFEEMEFPVRLAHPEVLSATAKAMALRLFDEIAVVPGTSINPGRRQGRGDPMILGRFIDPTRGYVTDRKRVTFFIAWWLRETDL